MMWLGRVRGAGHTVAGQARALGFCGQPGRLAPPQIATVGNEAARRQTSGLQEVSSDRHLARVSRLLKLGERPLNQLSGCFAIYRRLLEQGECLDAHGDLSRLGNV